MQERRATWWPGRRLARVASSLVTSLALAPSSSACNPAAAPDLAEAPAGGQGATAVAQQTTAILEETPALHEDRRREMVATIRRYSEMGPETIGQDVLDAMGRVPRHDFVPADQRASAYDDRPLPIGEGQTISQPYIVALMTELADLRRGDRVLEIGTGSGYQAAVLAELVDRVWTIEIVEPLGRRAAATFESLGIDNIEARIGDGYAGWPEHAPFDAILVTAAPDEIPAPLVEQLAPGGRLVVPVGSAWTAQQLTVVEKSDDGRTVRREVLPVRFVPLTRD